MSEKITIESPKKSTVREIRDILKGMSSSSMQSSDIAEALEGANASRDASLKEISKGIDKQNILLEIIARDSVLNSMSDLRGIQKLVKEGKAQQVFNIGDQIVVPWTDKAANKQYEFPFDIVHFGDVELQNGETVPGMFLQLHYAIPFGVQFDQYEAFYYAKEELAAGTYYVTFGQNWGNNVVSGKSYTFTLTKPVPAGGQISGFRGAPDQAPANWKVYTWENKTTTTPLETVAVVEGTEGTFLGALVAAGNEQLNTLHRVAYGYNRWSQSAIRQWLNSGVATGNWWQSQGDYDRPPDQLTTKYGFLSGFEEDFLSVLTPVKVNTALNTVIPADKEVAWDITYDKVFLPSLEQIYANPQITGEGEYFEYWKKASGADTPLAQYGTYPQMITYAVENHTSAQHVRLRSANRGGGSTTWHVYSSGHIGSSYASYASRCAPIVVIC